MPDIDAIQTLSPSTGTPFVPALDDYADASHNWQETEFRASTPGDEVVGAWAGMPGWVRIDNWPYTEVCVIRSGAVAIEAADGSRVEYGAGEAFVVPQGFRGIWHTLAPTDKIFVGIPT